MGTLNDLTPCALCGRALWWHLQKAGARKDDGHEFTTPYRLKKLKEVCARLRVRVQRAKAPKIRKKEKKA
jgi:hypothetical protein